MGQRAYCPRGLKTPDALRSGGGPHNVNQQQFLKFISRPWRSATRFTHRGPHLSILSRGLLILLGALITGVLGSCWHENRNDVIYERRADDEVINTKSGNGKSGIFNILWQQARIMASFGKKSISLQPLSPKNKIYMQTFLKAVRSD